MNFCSLQAILSSFIYKICYHTLFNTKFEYMQCKRKFNEKKTNSIILDNFKLKAQLNFKQIKTNNSNVKHYSILQ